MINVVLDSSIYCEDFQMSGARFRLFWSTLSAVGARLVVPAMVKLEVSRQYQKRLLEAVDRATANPSRHEETFRRRWMDGLKKGNIAELTNENMRPLWWLSYESHFNGT